MSKKDKEKEKEKRKKAEARRFPWAPVHARGLHPAEPGSAPEPPAAAADPPSRPPASEAPETRRSSPLPSVQGGGFEMRIPPLPPVTIEPRAQDDLVSDESAADIAPIGPTEHAAFAAGGPPSSPPSYGPESAAPTEVMRAPPSVADLEKQIRDLESRLDEMISRGSAPPADPQVPPPPSIVRPPPAPLYPTRPSPAPGDGARATARDLLPTDFYLRQWGRAGRRQRAEEVDEFGFDPAYEARYLPLFDFLYTTYFRVEAQGTSNIPADGRCLIVANHSGGPLPYDGLMLRTTVRREHPQARELRWLAEDFIYYLPFVGTAMNRLGAVRACPENAERLLATGKLVAVFPEGVKGIGKLYKERYRLQRFGRGGFIRLCLRTRTPLLPAAVVGAEEASPMLYRLEYMAKTLGLPYLPITPTFPALGPLGLLPAPTKWKVVFGEPMYFDDHAPSDADDEVAVSRLSERVRAAIQALLDRTLAHRRSIWFG
jgi:1-acyl-sn-glycerol-3-phosphate acyltransferase